MRKEAILRSAVSSASIGHHGTKFQSSESFAQQEPPVRRYLNDSSDASSHASRRKQVMFAKIKGCALNLVECPFKA
jgi:hypothetical protein